MRVEREAVVCKRKGAYWSVRLCDSGECTSKVTSRGVEALNEWCKEGLECSLEL